MDNKTEERTLARMVQIYCRHHHGPRTCQSCSALLEYGKERLDGCPFGEKKPVCSRCNVHCYKPAMRNEIKKVMRYSGPRMLFLSPLLTLRYMVRKWTVKP